jgi:6,7-dimethyl-8-ribityllumazine synthase
LIEVEDFMTIAAAPGSDVNAQGLTLGIVATRWHPEVTDQILSRAIAAAAACGSEPPRVVRVPGSLELPVIAAELARTHDAVVAVGVVIRGETPHFEYVCHAVTQELVHVAVLTGTPVGNAVLTCDTMEHAYDRSGAEGSAVDKGWGAVIAAFESALVLRSLNDTATQGAAM